MKSVKLGIILLVLLLVAMIMVPMVSADTDTTNHVGTDKNNVNHSDKDKDCRDQNYNNEMNKCKDNNNDKDKDKDNNKDHEKNCHKNLVTIENATLAATDLVSNIAGESDGFADWNGATVVMDTTYYDMTGTNSSYSYDVMVNGQYDGYVMVSATRDNYPVLEFTKGITPDKDAGTLTRAKQLAQTQIKNPKKEVLGEGQPVYLGATYFAMVYPVQMNNTKLRPQQISSDWILVDLIENRIVDQNDQRNAKNYTLQLNATEMKQLEEFQQLKIKEANAEWDTLENGADSGTMKTAASVLQATSGAGGRSWLDVPAYTWHWGCTPTSAAMVLGYLRDQGLTQLPNGDYRGDPLNHELANQMWTIYNKTDGYCVQPGDGPLCGMTTPPMMAVGMTDELIAHGIYQWGSYSNLDFGTNYDSDVAEINAGYPFVLSMMYQQNYYLHSVAVIGYASGQFLIVHDTWDTGDHYIHYNNWVGAQITHVYSSSMHTITANAGPNGSITPDGSISVPDGIMKTFTITPNSGYVIADVLVDGASVGAVGSYTFDHVTASHTISATFKQNLPAIVPLCQAGTPFDNTVYPMDTPQSDPMTFTCNWDGNGRVYISGSNTSLTGVYADDGFTITIQPNGTTFDAAEHWAHQHPVLELTSGMTPGSNTMTLIVRNWMGLSMHYGSKTGTGIDQTPWIIEVNSPTVSAAAAKISTASMPSFITLNGTKLVVNGTTTASSTTQ